MMPTTAENLTVLAVLLFGLSILLVGVAVVRALWYDPMTLGWMAQGFSAACLAAGNLLMMNARKKPS